METLILEDEFTVEFERLLEELLLIFLIAMYDPMLRVDIIVKVTRMTNEVKPLLWTVNDFMIFRV